MAVISLVVTSDRVVSGVKRDEVSPLVEALLAEKGHRLGFSTVVPNDWEAIRRAVSRACRESRIVLVTGGTGVSPRDISVDVVKSMASAELPGFGELHRRLSFERAGYTVSLSRASAFIVDGCLVAVSPGNPDAVKVAVEILSHIADHAIEELEGRGHRAGEA